METISFTDLKDRAIRFEQVHVRVESEFDELGMKFYSLWIKDEKYPFEHHLLQHSIRHSKTTKVLVGTLYNNKDAFDFSVGFIDENYLVGETSGIMIILPDEDDLAAFRLLSSEDRLALFKLD